MRTYSAITGASQAQRSPEGPAPAPLLSHMRRKPGSKQSNLRTFTKDIKGCKIKQSRPSPFVGRGCRINRWMTNSQGGWSHAGSLSRQAEFSCSPRQPRSSCLSAVSFTTSLPNLLSEARLIAWVFVLTEPLQRVSCSPFPFAHEQIIQEAKVLGRKGPEVGDRH